MKKDLEELYTLLSLLEEKEIFYIETNQLELLADWRKEMIITKRQINCLEESIIYPEVEEE